MKANTILSGLFKKVATSATLPLVLAVGMAVNADTVTTNGVTWTYIVNDASKKTVTLGAISEINRSSGPASDAERAIPASTEIGVSLIPWTFDVNGETYTVTILGAHAFNGCTKLVGTLSIPDAVKTIGRGCFASTQVRFASLGGVTTIYGYGLTGLPDQPFPDISGVTSPQAGVFYNSTFTGTARIPKNLGFGSWRAFASCKKLDALLALGPDTVTSGTQPTKNFSANSFVNAATNMKIVFMGPNTTASGMARAASNWATCLGGVTNCKMFVPNVASWHGDAMSTEGLGSEVIYYGATTNLDFTVEDDAGRIVAKPKTEAALLKVVESAPLFKKYFGWNTVVEVPNDLAPSAGSLTAGMFADLESNSLVLMFSVTTQAKMDSILAVVPAEATIGVDPTGLTEKITISRYDNVFVKSAPGVEIRRTVKGFFISFH